MGRCISARKAADRLAARTEVAFIDLREAGPFSEGHPLFAMPCPWSRFEERVGPLVPRRSVPVMLIDAGDGIAGHAAEALGAMGYANVSAVDGGAPAWSEAGFTLFKGVHVPSKTLGELAEEVFHPKMVDAAGLAEWRSQGRAFRLYDCRPAAEHAKMTIPGAVCLPNGELLHRLDAVPDDEPVVLTCAGRTRGVIGAASLGVVAPEREVYWLENGTQGWSLAGFELDYDNVPAPLPALDKRTAAATRSRAKTLMSAERIPEITPADVRLMLSEEARTSYLLDVRTPEEAAADPLPAFRPAAAVQLVQATDQWIGVRRARVVLADDLGLRGAIVAFWLRALGYETAVARISDELRSVPAPEIPRPAAASILRIDAPAAIEEVAAGRAAFIDVRPSPTYCAGHVAGATWSIRPRLDSLPGTPGRVLLIGDDTWRADLAGNTLRQMGYSDVAVVAGGTDALAAAGASVEQSGEMPLSEAIDVTSFAHGRHDGDRNASRLYLSWERGLIGQLSHAERAAFMI